MRLPCLALLATLAACTPREHADAAPVADSTPAGTVVDSIKPMPELIAQFRADLADPGRLGDGAAASRDALVAAFVDAVVRRDSAALEAMTLDRAEFAWLYFPHHMYAAPPYELPPATFWMLIRGNHDKGRIRILQRLGGSDLRLRDYRCEEAATVSLPVEEWQQCRLRVTLGGAPQEMGLFGSIVRIGDRFKFVSLANEF